MNRAVRRDRRIAHPVLRDQFRCNEQRKLGEGREPLELVPGNGAAFHLIPFVGDLPLPTIGAASLGASLAASRRQKGASR